MELGFSRAWLPYIYLYGAGGAFFIAGLAIVLKSKALNLKIARHQKWLGILIFGLLWYMFLHWFVTYAGMNF
ncbi:MAG: hypothetical protein HQ591_06045 [candidate division Zixibacteria bacterium]|nr:hypothetical protein [Candidatus Tariuqbacter arcticus]